MGKWEQNKRCDLGKEKQTKKQTINLNLKRIERKSRI